MLGERLELLQQMRELADTLAATAGRLTETVTTTSDPSAVEAEVTAMRAQAAIAAGHPWPPRRTTTGDALRDFLD